MTQFPYVCVRSCDYLFRGRSVAAAPGLAELSPQAVQLLLTAPPDLLHLLVPTLSLRLPLHLPVRQRLRRGGCYLSHFCLYIGCYCIFLILFYFYIAYLYISIHLILWYFVLQMLRNDVPLDKYIIILSLWFLNVCVFLVLFTAI